ncbi:MAG: efflux RND transporter periplasmic adaptor subunit [Bryobacteraceae bacterium]|nr:efflux RND transporter periplasmic adaptor subunit [Bryobacteraceae bacterium]
MLDSAHIQPFFAGSGRYQSLLLPIFLLGATSTFVSCSSKAQQQEGAQAPPPPTVEVIEAKQQNTQVYAEYPGQTYARNLVEVRGRVDGYIERWLFKPGQQVKVGQPLYVLDLRPYRAALQQAQGTLRQTEADLAYAEQQTSLLQADANLAAAKANLVRAQQDYERFKPLVEQDAAARQDLDAATAALRSAEANVRANEANVQTTKISTQTQVQSAEGRVQSQRGAVQTANLNVSYGTITSPIAGLIGDTLVPIGGLVNASSQTPLTTVAPLDPIWVRFKVSESQYLEFQRLRARSGNRVVPLELTLADNSRFPHGGRIENTLNQVDVRTGTLEMQAMFPNPERVVLPGQFGRVRFISEERPNVILIPQRAVTQNQNIQAVFVVGSDNKLSARPVKTGQRVGDQWIIEQGLKPGEKVVVEGLVTARPGAVVTPKPYRPDSGQKGTRKQGSSKG